MIAMTPEQALEHARLNPEENMFWMRPNPETKWILSPVSPNGMRYANAEWEYYGPVLNPTQVRLRQRRA